MFTRSLLITTAALALSACSEAKAPAPAPAPYDAAANRYEQTNFVADKAKYHPTVAREKKFVDAWGIATRPAGAGGHFWVLAQNVSYEYIGDVKNSPDEAMRTLHQDSFPKMTLPTGGKDNVGTGTVFNGSKTNFVITQEIKGAEPITAPAKFLFASDGGIISAWTERKKEDGTFDRSPSALAVIDHSKAKEQFFGLAISHGYDKLYAANFGVNPRVEVFDGAFQPLPITFDQPFDDNHNGKVDPGEYAPFNVQALTTPSGENHIFVAYAKTQACNKEGLAKKDCKKGELYAGEEDTSKPGQGRVAEFTEEGKLVSVINDGGHLSAPWGMTFAPSNFGALSGSLLVGNFGDGTIAAYDAKTHQFIDVLRDTKGKAFKAEGIWALVFGNGVILGDTNALYFAAGPADEKEGVFGSLRVAK